MCVCVCVCVRERERERERQRERESTNTPMITDMQRKSNHETILTLTFCFYRCSPSSLFPPPLTTTTALSTVITIIVVVVAIIIISSLSSLVIIVVTAIVISSITIPVISLPFLQSRRYHAIRVAVAFIHIYGYIYPWLSCVRTLPTFVSITCLFARHSNTECTLIIECQFKSGSSRTRVQIWSIRTTYLCTHIRRYFTSGGLGG